jgi:hypothetical protein
MTTTILKAHWDPLRSGCWLARYYYHYSSMVRADENWAGFPVMGVLMAAHCVIATETIDQRESSSTTKTHASSLLRGTRHVKARRKATRSGGD